MATLENNLYPPIIPDTQSSFIRTQNCRIYFSISIYNNINEIKNVQISLVNQKTNLSALNPTKYPSGIKIAQLNQITNPINDYNYYVDIAVGANSDLITNYFELNQYYLIQLRFTSVNAPNPPSNGTGLDSWLFDNRDYFSEWSQICLIKGIESPQIIINGLTTGNSIVQLSTPLDRITGKLYYNNTSETEYLKSYNINIYETNLGQNNSTYKTQYIYTNLYNPNEINCEIPYDLKRNVNYTLAFTYVTNNSYTKTLYYKFKILEDSGNKLDLTFSATADENHGRIILDIDFENSINTNNNLVIKRSSSKTNFYIYEILATIPHSIAASKALRYIWYDDSIESGVYYKYKIQQDVNENIHYLDIDKPIVCVFDDIFLTCGDRQLKIQFNPNVTDLKYNLMESQQVTLGSQYPFIRKNGNNYFRTFSISGLISSLGDDNNWYDPNFKDGKFHYVYEYEPFTTKEQLYGDSKELYQNYNSEKNIHEYYDYIYERFFRQKVMQFLYKNDIKLFRSLTEGNILIKLMNISFQPVGSLGRMLYSFSASAVEIDATTAANYKKYKVLNSYYHGFKSIKTALIEFKGYQSIVDKLKSLNHNIEKIYRMDIRTSNLKDAVIWVKHDKINEPIQYTLNGYSITIQSEKDIYPIEDCWFCGAHLSEDQYTLVDGYYMKTSDIATPIRNGVYEIVDMEEDSYRIDDYISYNNRAKELLTYPEEVEQKQDLTWNLFVNHFYKKYIYYDNKWYPFNDNGDVLIPIKAQITYYYEEKGDTI